MKEVMLNQEAEREHIASRKPVWEYFVSLDWTEAKEYAKKAGWKENKVQVRKVHTEYFVEPYEKDCGCKNIIPYED